MKPLVHWLKTLKYERLLVLVPLPLICWVARFAVATSPVMIDYNLGTRNPVSYAELCPRNPEGSLPLMISDIKNGPRLHQVVAGLGVPDSVYHDNYPHITGEATLVTVGLDYP